MIKIKSSIPSTKYDWVLLKRIQAIALALVILGAIFRFTNLDQKTYWIDEVFTSIRLAGYTEQEVIREAYQGQILTREDLLKYQQINRDRPLKDTLYSLATENAHHPPFYYILVKIWKQCFGDSIAATRSFSAVVSLLIFPVIYLLALELFKMPLAGYLALSLTAISPLHLAYAQEARSYSLWALEILLSSWLLLRAIRINTRQSWGFYILAMVAGLYTFVFQAFVFIGHGIYVLRTTWQQEKTILKNYIISAIIAIFVFFPWIFIIIQNLTVVARRTGGLKEKDQLVQKWLTNMSDLFFDLNQGSHYLRSYHILAWLLVGYAFYWLWKQKELTLKKAAWFVMSLSGATALSLMLFDLFFQRYTSVYERYMFPSYLGASLAVTFLLADKISNLSIKLQQRNLWKILTTVLIIGGILSCGLYLQSSYWWWTKGAYQNRHNLEIAAIINPLDKPLLIADDSTTLSGCFVCRMLTLNYLLSDRVNFQLVRQPNLPQIPSNYSDVFVFSPNESLLLGLQKQYNLDLILDKDDFQLYKLMRTS